MQIITKVLSGVAIGLILFVFYSIITQKLLFSPDILEEGMEPGNPSQGTPSPKKGLEEDPATSCDALPLSAYEDTKNLPLREYAIMSSFNSAYDGKAVTGDQLKEILARGYRFIDLNVFVADPGNKGEKKVYVGHAVDNQPTLGDNTLLFGDAMKIIHQMAFVKGKSKRSLEKGKIPMTEETIPKSTDTSLEDNYKEYPLFLHLRIFRAENSNVNVVKEMMEMLEEEIGSTWYHRKDKKAVPVSGCTKLGDLKKKVIISMDITNLIQIYTPTIDSSAELIPPDVRQLVHSFANVFTGGHTWQSFYHYEDVNAANTKLLRVVDSGKRTNIDRWFIAFPFVSNKSNPPSIEWMRQFSVQCSPLRVYLDDASVEDTEAFFRNQKKPFVPMKYVLSVPSAIQ
jgi:hypothetical protein